MIHEMAFGQAIEAAFAQAGYANPLEAAGIALAVVDAWTVKEPEPDA